MPLLGKSIHLYLMDGTTAGRWQAALSNWNGIAYKIPRGMLKECFADLAELNTPGVYFLFGRDDSTWRQFIYIGEGDDVLKRLTQPHTFLYHSKKCGQIPCQKWEYPSAIANAKADTGLAGGVYHQCHACGSGAWIYGI